MSDQNTFGNRLKMAREKERFSRPALSKQTGIPVKSLEKFEYGELEPNITRLRVLAETLKVTVEYLLEGSDIEPETVLKQAPPSTETSSQSVMEQLRQLDDMRLKGFEKFWRSAPRMFALLEGELAKLNEDSLLDLAEVRGLFPVSTQDWTSEEKEAVATRIVDTGYFGVDLIAIKQQSLSSLADDLDIEPDNEGFIFDSWSSESAMVSALRKVLRIKALKGEAEALTNERKFPKREVA